MTQLEAGQIWFNKDEKIYVKILGLNVINFILCKYLDLNNNESGYRLYFENFFKGEYGNIYLLDKKFKLKELK